MIQFTVYIVDDEESIRKGVFLALKKDYRMKAFSRAETAINELKKLLVFKYTRFSGLYHQLKNKE
jgi:FixJ family two-component response regulator